MEVCTVDGDAGHPTLTGPLKITCAVLRPVETQPQLSHCPKSVSRLGWVVSSVEGHHSGQAAGSQSPSPSPDNTQQRGEKGAAKSKKWFEFSMKRSPLCWRLFTPDIATPPLPPPHRRTAGVWTFLLGWRRRHVLKSWHSYFYFHCFISLGWDIWQQKRILNLNLIKTQ